MLIYKYMWNLYATCINSVEKILTTHSSHLTKALFYYITKCVQVSSLLLQTSDSLLIHFGGNDASALETHMYCMYNQKLNVIC